MGDAYYFSYFVTECKNDNHSLTFKTYCDDLRDKVRDLLIEANLYPSCNSWLTNDGTCRRLSLWKSESELTETQKGVLKNISSFIYHHGRKYCDQYNNNFRRRCEEDIQYEIEKFIEKYGHYQSPARNVRLTTGDPI